jgi:hypothetical protein
MDDNVIPARAVTGLLQEILSALDTGPDVRPARASHVVRALRHLLTGPVPGGGDVIAVTAILTAHIAETPASPAAASTALPAADPEDGPFRDRMEAGAAFARFREAAERGTSGPPGEQLVFTRGQHLAEALTDTVEDLGAELGGYDRQLAAWLGELLDPTDIGVICSWIRRAAHDRPDLQLPEAGQ